MCPTDRTRQTWNALSFPASLKFNASTCDWLHVVYFSDMVGDLKGVESMPGSRMRNSVPRQDGFGYLVAVECRPPTLKASRRSPQLRFYLLHVVAWRWRYQPASHPHAMPANCVARSMSSQQCLQSVAGSTSSIWHRCNTKKRR